VWRLSSQSIFEPPRSAAGRMVIMFGLLWS
jgi:hypothetical protein